MPSLDGKRTPEIVAAILVLFRVSVLSAAGGSAHVTHADSRSPDRSPHERYRYPGEGIVLSLLIVWLGEGLVGMDGSAQDAAGSA